MSKSTQELKKKDLVDAISSYINNDKIAKNENDRLEGIKIFFEEGKKYGVTLEEKDFLKNSFLHQAVSSNKNLVAKYLIDEKADINALNKNNETILHIAAKRKNDKFIKYLISNDKISGQKNDPEKINIDAVDKFKTTAAELSEQVGAIEVTKILQEFQAYIIGNEDMITQQKADEIEDDFTQSNKIDVKETSLLEIDTNIVKNIDLAGDILSDVV